MAIYAPGLRDRHNRLLADGAKGRSAVAILSLTAMVDMFTVLAVFLLQNYKSTGEVIELADNVMLPNANQVRELRPSIVVVVSKERISLDHIDLAKTPDVDAMPEMESIPNLVAGLQDAFRAAEEKAKSSTLAPIRDSLQAARGQQPDVAPENFRRVTLQADKSVPSGVIKKVMFSLTEAGSTEINFAVVRPESGGA